MGIASFILSIIGLVFGAIGLVPLFGIFEWIALALAVMAFILAIVPISRRLVAPLAIVGLILSIVVIALAVVRLAVGGWFT
ncbi:hypothetical protein GX441_02920 [bacterium]|nr:hypothetical protein [bacterium]